MVLDQAHADVAAQIAVEEMPVEIHLQVAAVIALPDRHVVAEVARGAEGEQAAVRVDAESVLRQTHARRRPGRRCCLRAR